MKHPYQGRPSDREERILVQASTSVGRKAVLAVLAEGKKVSHDLGGSAGTTEIAEAIASRV